MEIAFPSPAPHTLPHGSSRVASIDAARGTAMLFVCLAHFTNSYFFLNGREDIGGNLVVIGMIASPTFVAVSGLVAGFLAVTRGSSFAHLRRKLIDRGLFLLLFGHLVLALSGLVTGKSFVHAYRVEYITDAIGFAILIGPWLVTRLSGRSRLLLAATVFALDWWAILFWGPSEGIPALAKQYLVGIVNPGQWELTSGGFPAIPWTAVYLVGTVIGERVGSYYVGKRQTTAHLLLAKLGFLSVVCTLGVKISLVLLRRSAPLFVQAHPTLMHFLSFYQKFPPGPVYLCFFGGAGMLLVAGILEAGRRGMQPFLLNQLRQIGLASFFVYIVQFYVYGVVERSLRIPYTPFWPLIFLSSIVLLAMVASVWNSREGNRFLTVGIGPLLERIALRRRTILEKPITLETPTA
jgi:uncharacterized membrane protein